MTDYFELLKSISQEFNIKRGTHEDELSWMARVIYSFLGQTGYSSLWDIQEDLQPASITHFKARIEKALESIIDIYPEMISAFSLGYEQQSEEIYQILKDSGVVYHSPYRLIVPPRKTGIGVNNTYIRGNSLSEKRWVSGLGCYYPLRPAQDANSISLSEMFQLQKPTLTDIWKSVLSQAQWTTYIGSTDFEYLRLRPPFRSGYWTEAPDYDGTISLARQRIPGSDLYYLYKQDNNTIYFSQLPAWMTSDNDYRALSNACLSTQKTLPPTSYKIDGDIVFLHIDYLYPPEEMNVIRLYSWPNTYINYPHNFNRVMTTSVFYDIRHVLEMSGYQFVEE